MAVSALPPLLLCLVAACTAAQWGVCPNGKFKNVQTDHTACLLRSPFARPFKLTYAQRQELLDAHNNFRRNVWPAATNIPEMTWDEDLEFLATKWAENCEAGHDEGRRSVPKTFNNLGQNMFGGPVSFLQNMTRVVGVWYNEVKDFTFGSRGNNYYKTAHYIQVISSKSYKLGCGGAICGGGAHFYCNYGPPMDYGENRWFSPYKLGARGSDCLRDDDGICDCGNIHCNLGDLDPHTCKCINCPEFTTSGPNCAWTGHKCEDTLGTAYCMNLANSNGGRDAFCHTGPFSAWAKPRCYKFCGLCCEDLIGSAECRNYADSFTKNGVCEGMFSDWFKGKCNKMCGHC